MTERMKSPHVKQTEDKEAFESVSVLSGIKIRDSSNAASVFGQFVKSDIEQMWRLKCSHDIYAWKPRVLQSLEYFKTERSLKASGSEPRLEYGRGTQRAAE